MSLWIVAVEQSMWSFYCHISAVTILKGTCGLEKAPITRANMKHPCSSYLQTNQEKCDHIAWFVHKLVSLPSFMHSHSALPKIKPIRFYYEIYDWFIMAISLFLFILFIYCFTAQVLKVCRTPGPTACSKTKMVFTIYIDGIANRLGPLIVSRSSYTLINFMPHPLPHPLGIPWRFDIASCPHPWDNWQVSNSLTDFHSIAVFL